MKPKIIQIAVGEIPANIAANMATVTAWADRMEYDYELITELDEDLQFLPARNNGSDFQRVRELAKHSHIAVLDWDIVINEDLVLGDDPQIFPGDCALYNGNRSDVFVRALELMGEPRQDMGIVYHTLVRMMQDDYKIFVESLECEERELFISDKLPSGNEMVSGYGYWLHRLSEYGPWLRQFGVISHMNNHENRLQSKARVILEAVQAREIKAAKNSVEKPPK